MIWEKLCKLEQHIINLIVPIQGIAHSLNNSEMIRSLVIKLGQPLEINDIHLREDMKELKSSIFNSNYQNRNLDLKTTLNEIKFIGKRIHDIETSLKHIEKTGIKQSFTLSLIDSVPNPVTSSDASNLVHAENLLINLKPNIPPRDYKIITSLLGICKNPKIERSQLPRYLGLSDSYTKKIINEAINRTMETCQRSSNLTEEKVALISVLNRLR
jgi:hypothetical protein